MIAIFVVTLICGGTTFRVEPDPKRERPLRILRGGRLIVQGARQRWEPWHLEVGDVDGDGIPEIAIGVNKPTRFLRDRHTSVFFYSFNGKRLVKKWLGSSLGRPLVEFCLVSPSPMKPARLITLQRTLDGRIALNRYAWSGFGFRRDEFETTWTTARHMHRIGAKIELIADGRRQIVDPFASP